ncbi:MAG TPA: LysM peptidoglycan-binding domain-containing protein [Mobilitalea sp.]|nr:LysM peptidoglycan-binding domain-containing protein [Mobilitalea sp.]
MYIHVVQPGDTIQSIADTYGLPPEFIIRDNGLDFPDNLVIGQCIVIAIPQIIYTVQRGDTLTEIAASHNVSVMQLLQNNPYLADREYIYPGDRIVISYEKTGYMATHSITLPFASIRTLRKTLPYLTYISVVNYTATDEGDIVTYHDDTEFIRLAKEYNTIPLMFLTTLTLQGEANIRAAFNLLLNEDIQDRLAANILNIIKAKGFYGINISFEFITHANLPYVERAYARIANRIISEGYLAFATINPDIRMVGNAVEYFRIDYTLLDQIADNVLLMNYEWAINPNPPSPISSIYDIEIYLNYFLGTISPNKLNLGISTIGYDWELPYFTGISEVRALTYDSAVALARNENVPIQFDEVSQTPFFLYTENGATPREHIVWFIDARSIHALLNLVADNNLHGIGIWNISVFNPQLWLLVNSQYEIVKREVN